MTTTTTVPVDGVDLGATLRPLAFLPGDPCVRLSPGRFARATVTPAGNGTVTVTWEPAGDRAVVTAEGPGADWMLERAPALLGVDDDPTGFEPSDPPLRDLWRRHRGDRMGRTATLWHDLAWFIVQQRVSGNDAARQWRRLVTALGTPAPGPDGLCAPPSPAAVARLSYPDLHLLGIERRRAEHLIAAARAIARRPDLGDAPFGTARPVLAAVPGVGPWTISWVRAQTWGDPDAVIVGDYGIPATVAWLLAGERTDDDARLLELLAPYRPHRHRVIRLAHLAGSRPPRRHHRLRSPDIRRH